METVKQFALLLLFVSAACCIYYFLLPGGSVSATAKKLLSVFFLFCVTVPLFSVLEQGFSLSLLTVPAQTQAVSAEAEPFAAADAGHAHRYTAGNGDIRA